jgi:non-ribosomal peptide synthetase component F
VIAGTTGVVLDEARQPVADGADGELYLGGAGLALGYLHRPELNAEKFIVLEGDRWYRTGDRVRRGAGGVFEFLGRVDRQVKIGGKRVELDGIEACLRASGKVTDAAAIAVGDEASRRSVAAFVTPAVAPLEELREFLRAELPDFMVPSTLRALDALPLSANGKVDRAALAPLVAPPAPAAAAAPAVGMETALLEIWREALGRADVGLDQNFFDLGGTSLQLMRVHAAIQARIRADVQLLDLFAHPRIRALAAWLGGADGDGVEAARLRTRRENAERARRRPSGAIHP